jgi:hypothetical protein
LNVRKNKSLRSRCKSQVDHLRRVIRIFLVAALNGLDSENLLR